MATFTRYNYVAEAEAWFVVGQVSLSADDISSLSFQRKAPMGSSLVPVCDILTKSGISLAVEGDLATVVDALSSDS